MVRTLVLGIVLGIAATLALAAATDTDRYQVAAAVDQDRSRAIVVVINTRTGKVNIFQRPTTEFAGVYNLP